MIGKWFESYEEAWSCFLARDEPLEDFWSNLSEADSSFLAGWLIKPPAAVKDAVSPLLVRLAELAGVSAVPGHFAHVWIHGVAEDPDPARVIELVAAARDGWASADGFDIAFRCANCFHDAAVVEAHTEGVAQLLQALNPKADLRVVLPHMTVAYLRSPLPGPLRAALQDFRDQDFGTFHVHDVNLCLVPIARSTFLRPWEVAATISLSRPSG